MNIDFKKSLQNQVVQLVLFALFVVIVMSFLKPKQFLSPYNFESIMFSFPELGLLSLAIMVTMLSGGIDLSVVAIANLCGILSGKLFIMLADAPIPIGIKFILVVGAALFTGISIGCLNGFLITRLKITPILATLGSSQLIMGIGVVLTGGAAVIGFPEIWATLGSGKFIGLANPFLIFIIVALLLDFILRKTAFGVELMLIGSNAKAAIFSGIRNDKIIYQSYMISATIAATAGLIMSSRANSAKADYGSSYLLQAVLISVLGGTNPAGGRGRVIGVAVAVITLMLISSGLRMLRMSDFFIDCIWGIFLLLVMLINYWNSKKNR